eukprot:403344051
MKNIFNTDFPQQKKAYPRLSYQLPLNDNTMNLATEQSNVEDLQQFEESMKNNRNLKYYQNNNETMGRDIELQDLRQLPSNNVFKEKESIDFRYKSAKTYKQKNSKQFSTSQDKEDWSEVLINNNEKERVKYLKQKIIDKKKKFSQDPFNEETIIPADTYVDFDKIRFFKMLLYHIAYFEIGPFISVPIIYAIEGKNFVINMGFWGVSFLHFQNFLQVFFMEQLNFIFIFQAFSNVEVNFIEFFSAQLITIIRILMIALRYATTSRTRFEQQSVKRFTKEERNQEYIQYAWRDLSPKVIDNEIKNSMIRNEIENITFHVMFLSQLGREFVISMNNYNYYDHTDYNVDLIKSIVKQTAKKMDEQSINHIRQIYDKSKLALNGNNQSVKLNPSFIQQQSYSIQSQVEEKDRSQLNIGLMDDIDEEQILESFSASCIEIIKMMIIKQIHLKDTEAYISGSIL